MIPTPREVAYCEAPFCDKEACWTVTFSENNATEPRCETHMIEAFAAGQISVANKIYREPP